MKSVEALRIWADGLGCIWVDPNDNSIIVTTCDDMPPSIDCVNLREHVNAILDGIEREVDEMWHALTIDAKPMTDENMAADGWVRLPVDADGVPIHVGDVLEWPDTSTAEVVGIGNGTFFYVEDGEDAAEWSCASDKIHHHEPTVEDVLREFAAQVTNGQHIHGAIEIEQAIAGCAAKLRLAGEDE